MRAAAGCIGVVVIALPSCVSFSADLGFVALELTSGQSPIRPRPRAMFLPLAAVDTAVVRSPARMLCRRCTDPMSSTLTPQQLDAYRRTMHRRAAEADTRRAERREAAWAVAREAADLLRSRYGATRALAFGSLAEGTHFSERSDIDLAVEGLRPSDHFAALGWLLTLSPDFELDLVDLGACPPGLRAVILAEGVPL
jgi:predicted nucleotidyltransferase